MVDRFYYLAEENPNLTEGKGIEDVPGVPTNGYQSTS